MSNSAVSSEATTNSHEEIAKRAAAAFWHCEPKDTFAQSLSALYPWLHKHSIFLVKNIKHVKILIVVSQKGVATPFASAKAIGPLNGLLESENIQLPDSLSPEKLSSAIRAFTLGPGGFVASPSFWDAQQRSLKMWTTRDPTGGPALFHKYCQNPVLLREGQHWKLGFYYFNDKGGVEKWSVSGDARKILDIDSSPAAPDGTFVFPYG